MPAPQIGQFGDASHQAGEGGISIGGGGFGAFPGSAWMYELPGRTGDVDQLSIVSWNDIEIVVNIPASLNNTPGTKYLSVQREDLAWSNEFQFALEAVTLFAARGVIVLRL